MRLGFQIAGMLAEGAAADDLDGAPPEPHERALRIGTWILLACIAWTCLVMLKITLGVNLVSYASRRYAARHVHEREERLNAKGRAPIGEAPTEAAQRAQLHTLVNHTDDNAGSVGLYGQQPPGHPKHTSLVDVSRFQMAGSRLW